jgi:hypothetical protein
MSHPITQVQDNFKILSEASDDTSLSSYFPITIKKVKENSSVISNKDKHGAIQLASRIHSALVSTIIAFARDSSSTTSIAFTRNDAYESTTIARDGKWSRYTGYVVAEEFTRGASLLISSFVDIIGALVHPASFNVSSWNEFKKDVKNCINNHGLRAGSVLTLCRLLMTGFSIIVSLGQAAIDAALFMVNKLSAFLIGGIVHLTVLTVPLIGKGLLCGAIATGLVIAKTLQVAIFPVAALVREARAAYNKERFSSREQWTEEGAVKAYKGLSSLALYGNETLEQKATNQNLILGLIGKQKAYMATAKKEVIKLNDAILGSIPTTKLSRALNYFEETTNPFHKTKEEFKLSDTNNFIKNATESDLAMKVSNYTPNITEKDFEEYQDKIHLQKAQDLVRSLHFARLLITKKILNTQSPPSDLINVQCALIGSDRELLEMALREPDNLQISAERNIDGSWQYFNSKDCNTSGVEKNEISLIKAAILTGIHAYNQLNPEVIIEADFHEENFNGIVDSIENDDSDYTNLDSSLIPRDDQYSYEEDLTDC